MECFDASPLPWLGPATQISPASKHIHTVHAVLGTAASPLRRPLPNHALPGLVPLPCCPSSWPYRVPRSGIKDHVYIRTPIFDSTSMFICCPPLPYNRNSSHLAFFRPPLPLNQKPPANLALCPHLQLFPTWPNQTTRQDYITSLRHPTS
ncbi:hypothetical protein B0I35DRAFT_219843 [Stachybotrys elegans]|uniref:Uncharacterized protein n=1 Tax=Stachybotrys elegans TaxID=80388 RepID=A0A8K0SXH2_9HYPO|nr:hypothetical protein B0I35DRAFT_219843 [Stachybotrys elegans]